MSQSADGWPEVRLGDLVDLQAGYAFQSSHYCEPAGGIKLLRGDNVIQRDIRWDGAKYWPRTMLGGVERYELTAGDVVLAMDRPWIEAGLKVSVVRPGDLPALLVQRVARLRAQGRDLEQAFLPWVLFSQAFTDHILGVQTGTAVPHVSSSQICSFQFRLPPLAEQRRIADVLGALDELIEAERRQAQLLESLARALGARLAESLVGEEQPLTDMADVTSGYSYSSAELVPGDAWLVNLKNVARHGAFARRGFKPLSLMKRKSGQVIDTGDILVAQTDLTQARDVIARPVRVRRGNLQGELVASLDLAVVRPKGYLTREVIFALLDTADFRRHALGYCNGTTVLHLGSRALPDYQLPLPSREQAAVFTAQVVPLWEAADASDQAGEDLAAVRDHLLPLLLSGRIQVKDLELAS